MGDFSRDPDLQLADSIARHYVGVRLQQGVPIVDADWNELEAIRKYEMQTFRRWFVGNGIPDGNDGFQIAPIDSVDNDFLISGGDGTAEPRDSIAAEAEDRARFRRKLSRSACKPLFCEGAPNSRTLARDRPSGVQTANLR